MSNRKRKSTSAVNSVEADLKQDQEDSKEIISNSIDTIVVSMDRGTKEVDVNNGTVQVVILEDTIYYVKGQVVNISKESSEIFIESGIGKLK